MIKKKKEQCCLAFIDSYIGLSMSDSKNESLHNCLKDIIQQQQHYTSVVPQTLAFIDDLNRRSFVNECQKFEA